MSNTDKEKVVEPVLHTVDELDKKQENTKTNTEDTKEDNLKEELEKITKERDEYKSKYTKAIEVNNQLYQRLTSNAPVEKSALEDILNRF